MQFLLTRCCCALLQDLVNKYSAAVDNQKSKVAQLEQDQRNLADDISSLDDEVAGLQTVTAIFLLQCISSRKIGSSGLRLCLSPYEGRQKSRRC